MQQRAPFFLRTQRGVKTRHASRLPATLDASPGVERPLLPGVPLGDASAWARIQRRRKTRRLFAAQSQASQGVFKIEAGQFPIWLGPPVVPFYPFLGQGSPTKIDYRTRTGTLIPTSLLEDLVAQILTRLFWDSLNRPMKVRGALLSSACRWVPSGWG